MGIVSVSVALVSGWLVPGLGHAILGRTRRALFFFVIVLGSFALGMAHGGRLALHDRQQAILSALQVVANAGVGAADAAARLAVYGELAYTLPSETGHPGFESRVRTFRDRNRSAVSAYGTAYLWTAGLMNLLLLLDVLDIGRGRKG